MKEALKAKARKLEAYADIIEMLEQRLTWFQHSDENDINGALIDDDSEYAAANLEAIRDAIKAVCKLAGV